MPDKVSNLLLFGATGDLARRMLLPSLYGLAADRLLPQGLRIICTARSEHSDNEYRAIVRDALSEHLAEDFFNDATAEDFLARIRYVAVDIGDRAGFARLASAIGDVSSGLAIFLSTAPSLFRPVIEGLEAAGLTSGKVRMALEKPLGSDLNSSREINDAVAAAFPEERTFRIDHYLGKETVQNLLALRFANAMFEPLWNRSHVDAVEITIAEAIGIEGRGEYYDGAGALRDMVQNHMLQLLALVAMEPPARFDGTAVRDEKVKVLRSLRPIDASDARDCVTLGQYRGYPDELGRPSATETFARLTAHVDNWRWKDVPFTLTTGKRLSERNTEIVIRFKPVPYSIFAERGADTKPNRLTISIQPEENITLALMAKTPGLDRTGIRLREVELEIDRPDAFADHRRRIAYERLLLDLIEGDPTLFVRRDEVEAQWAWIDDVRAAIAEAGVAPKPYAAGSDGP
jgi:glucose-6-phosphate 1-dehydrogenase